MKLPTVGTILKSLPLIAAAASAHIAFAMPGQTSNTAAIAALAMGDAVAQLTADQSSDGFQVPPTESAPAEIAPAIIAETPADAPDDRQIECIAKVIVHEAGNQPVRGQIAVAQVIRTRVKDGRFGRDACSVVLQRGQFFNVNAYSPSRTDARWSRAVDIATDTLQGEGEEVVPGALFFHSAGASMPGRVRVAQVAGHTFYR